MTVRAAGPPRVQLVGYLRTENGLGQVARLLYDALVSSGVDCHAVDWPFAPSRKEHELSAPVGALSSPASFDLTILCVNALETPEFFRTMRMPRAGRIVGVWAWEVTEFPAEMATAQAFVDEVWVYSGFAARAIAPTVSKPVLVLPMPIGAPGLSLSTPSQGPSFTFLSSFDMYSVFGRKNPLGVLEAYSRAFPVPSPDVRLLIKVINGETDPVGLDRLRSRCGKRADVSLIETYLDSKGQQELIASCDAFVSLHRSEGFGLMLAEAMSLGKPVIATGYSGNLEFMNPWNSLLVDYRLVDVGPGHDPYPATAEWAEPDVADAARKMSWVASHPAEAAVIGRRARQSVVGSLSPALTAAFVSTRIAEFRRNDRNGHARVARVTGPATQAQPGVTVAIPVYNGARFLDECLDSARSQSFGSLEILVLDDCSTDGSVEIAERHAAADSRIRVVRNPVRLGLGGNFTACLTQARREWVKYLLQDDLLHPTCVATMMAAASGAPLVVCGREYRYEGVTEERRAGWQFILQQAATRSFDVATRISAEAFAELALTKLYINFVGEPTAVMQHRDTAIASGPYDDAFLQPLDLEFAVRLGAQHGATFVPETLVTFRCHPAQATERHVAAHALSVELFDEVLYLAKLAHDPAYESLRKVAASMRPPVDLLAQLDTRLVLASRAVRSDTRRDVNGRTAEEQWMTLIESDPILRSRLDRIAAADELPVGVAEAMSVAGRVGRWLYSKPNGDRVAQSLTTWRRRLTPGR